MISSRKCHSKPPESSIKIYEPQNDFMYFRGVRINPPCADKFAQISLQFPPPDRLSSIVSIGHWFGTPAGHVAKLIVCDPKTRTSMLHNASAIGGSASEGLKCTTAGWHATEARVADASFGAVFYCNFFGNHQSDGIVFYGSFLVKKRNYLSEVSISFWE